MSSEGEIVDDEIVPNISPSINSSVANNIRESSRKYCHSILVHDLPPEKSLSSCYQSLMIKFKKYGRISSLFINLIPNSLPQAIISYQSNESCHVALNSSHIKTIFGRAIKYHMVKEFSRDTESFHLARINQRISRFLQITIMERQVQKRDLIDFFQNHGRVIECEIRQKTTTKCLLQFDSFKSAHAAHQYTKLKNFGSKPIKACYEMSQPSNTLILSSITLAVPANIDLYEFLKLPIVPLNVIFDRPLGTALLFFDSRTNASETLNDLKDKIINMKFFEVDYANINCQIDFIGRLSIPTLSKNKNYLQSIGFRIIENGANHQNIFANSSIRHDVSFSNKKQKQSKAFYKSTHADQINSKPSNHQTSSMNDQNLSTVQIPLSDNIDDNHQISKSQMDINEITNLSNSLSTNETIISKKNIHSFDESSQGSYSNHPIISSDNANSKISDGQKMNFTDISDNSSSASSPSYLNATDNQNKLKIGISITDDSLSKTSKCAKIHDFLSKIEDDSEKYERNIDEIIKSRTIKYPLSVLYEDDEFDKKFKDICGHIKKTQQYINILNGHDNKQAAIEKILNDPKFA